MNVECVIISVDGLLFTTHQLYKKITEDVASNAHLSIPEDYFDSLLGAGYDLKEETMYRFPTMALKEPEIMDSFLHHLFSNGSSLVNAEVLTMINQLPERGFKVALTSDYPKSVFEHLLNLIDLDPRIEVKLHAHQVVHGKPFGNINYKAASLTKTRPLHSIVIETTKNGVHAAHMAFMRSVFISGVLPQTERIFKYSYRQLSDISQLIPLLQNEQTLQAKTAS